MSEPVRKSSIHHLLGPSTPPPAPEPIPYNPRRRTPASSILTPISRIEELQCVNPTGNPLRIASFSSESQNAHPDAHHFASNASSLPPKPAAYNPQEHWNGGGGNKRHSSDGNGGGYQPQRKRRRSNEDTFAVAGHYNSRPNIGVEARKESPIIGLKNFNNWTKSVLIAKFGRRETDRGPKLKVLDLGCGKGGDLQKWARAGTDEYIGIDLAAVSVEQARSRWENMRGQRFQADFFTLDCFGRSISECLRDVHVQRPFDIVSMQFCMHYAFDAEAKVRQMLENVVRYLRPGGVFIGTIPDSARLEEIPEEQEVLEFGNAVYRVQFDERDNTPRYGHRYTFFLQDAVEEVPEYIVYWENFIELAAEYGLQYTYHNDFQAIFSEEGSDPHFKDLLSRMKVVDANGDTEMSMDQWEAANLYVGFAFTMMGGEEEGAAEQQ
ncbi:mRNA (guanine-N7-)-methyltransferase [Pseudohyphozyma bogoriensis]|nr:mRNA (guanine-N7-)-methyltransferase [Pseudohyphozyma bogoriensis]